MTYRLRMVSGEWWLYIYKADNTPFTTLGPYATIGEAESVAADTGYADRDRG